MGKEKEKVLWETEKVFREAGARLQVFSGGRRLMRIDIHFQTSGTTLLPPFLPTSTSHPFPHGQP